MEYVLTHTLRRNYADKGIVWVEILKLQPVEFPGNPMSRLVGSSSRRMGLLNMLVDRKLQLMSEETSESKTPETIKNAPLLVMFSGKPGTGKTAMVKAIAELHKRPLISLEAPRSDMTPEDIRTNFARLLENAVAWKAIILLDNAFYMMGKTKKEPFFDQISIATDHSIALRRFRGIVFLTKRDDEQLIQAITQQIQLHIAFEPFTNKKRKKLWQLLLRGDSDDGIPLPGMLPISDETLTEMSKWELNGRDIEHLHRNMQLLYPPGYGEDITIQQLEDLRDLTFYFEEEQKQSGSCEPSKIHEQNPPQVQASDSD